ncbi:DUF2568 domain-containing protein [Gordonia sp. TBRC 11910]|uniref:DUF2568 domain-containing protein n=1 Tax=Gordonia asplenii TaxID=2725283 RepID=A0A848KVQ6_9ACTN|nr:DUF2568 domain-containing protein [Gordonia asplenii]NMO00271.1 DUF2568 domain-containing protein [Gordonia asplenii]
MTHDVNANDIVAFLIEIAALLALGIAAWQLSPQTTLVRLIAVIATVGTAMVLWGLFAAPEATFDVAALAIAVKALVLGSSVVATYLITQNLAATTLWALVVLINTALIYVGPFARA